MHILITGGTGFIGKNLVDYLLRQGHNLSVITRNSGSINKERLNFIICDLCDLTDANLPASVDAVVHLAQSQNYRDFPNNAEDIFKINVTSTNFIVDWSFRKKVKSFIFASSGSIYVNKNINFDESYNIDCNYYSASKIAAEELIWPYLKYINCCSLRLFTPYGFGQENRLIPLLENRIINKESITLNGNCNGLEFGAIHISDLVEVIYKAIIDGWNGPFDVAESKPTSIREVSTLIGEIVGIKPIFQKNSQIHSTSLLPNLNKLSKFVEISKFLNIKAGILKTIIK